MEAQVFPLTARGAVLGCVAGGAPVTVDAHLEASVTPSARGCEKHHFFLVFLLQFFHLEMKKYVV